MVSSLRRLRAPAPPPAGSEPAAEGGACELCPSGLAEEHRHLLHLDQRRILCVCEACWAMRAGDAEFRPVGNRTLWMPGLDLPDELWARFAIPIGLAFFFHSGPAEKVIALYPSPAGATECELDLDAWADLIARNPLLGSLEPDCEGLVVNRMSQPHQYALAPIDKCYELVGRIKASWEGISGGPGVEVAVQGFFAGLATNAAGRRVR